MLIELPGSLSDYSPDVYFAVYRAVLRHRAVTRVIVDEIVSTDGSPHELDESVEELVPARGVAPNLIAWAEREGHESVAARAALWYDT